MSILATTAILILISVSVKSQDEKCVSNTFKCSDCVTLVGCFGETETPLPCATGQVCGNNGASELYDSCFEASDISNTKLSECSCDASAASASYVADPFDPKKYLACLPGNPAPQSLECTGDKEVFLEGEIPPCGEAPPTTTEPPTTPTIPPVPFTCSADKAPTGFHADTEDCSKYWLCTTDTDPNPTDANCPDGQVFNTATLGCFDPCDSSAETFTCGDTMGAVADSVNCSIFHICVNGNPIGQPIPCTPSDKFFNPETGACDATDCATSDNPCLTCSTTTVGPTTTNGDTTPSTPTDPDTTPTTPTEPDTTPSTPTDPDTTPSTPTEPDTTPTTPTDPDTTPSTPTDPDTTPTTPTDPDTTPTTPTEPDTTPTTPTEPDTTTSTSTTTSSSTTVGVPDCTSASEEGYFPNADDCKKFYACETDRTGEFVQREYTCPGSLVFDPTNKYCNLPNMVPGCG